ncbi:MAG: ABC transporter permease [Chloroflexi bacterium]|nr:ABC transporter permease [Chloroflexota bacterium]
MKVWGKLASLTPLILSLRNMLVRWQRTALTCLGIVLGVAVILAISVTNDSTLKSLRQVFDEASGKASLLVQSSSADGGGFDGSIVSRVTSQDGVIAAAPAAHVTTLLARDAPNWQIAFGLGGRASGNTLELVGVDPDIDPKIREYDIATGRWIKGDKYEAVITEKYADEKQLKIGDDLVILIPAGQERLRIVGLISKTGAGLLNDGIVAFAPLPVVQDLFGRGKNVDELDVVVKPDIANSPEELAALKARLATRLGNDHEVSYPASRGQLVTQMLSTYQKGLWPWAWR